MTTSPVLALYSGTGEPVPEMPFSLGRSYDDLPSADSDGSNDRRVKVSDEKPATGIPAEPRSPRYRAILPIICVVAVVLCLVDLGSKGLAREPWFPMSTPSEVQAAPASATQAVSERQASASEDLSPSPVPASNPTETLLPLSTAAGLPANSWSADIPEAACIPADLPQTGRVVDVSDADTIRVLMDRDGRVYSVNYLGVMAPESSGEGVLLGQLALARNTELVYRKQVVLVRDISDADSSGTLLRYVMVEDVFVNQALIAEGWAQAEMNSPDTACQQTFLAAQQQAQREARGMWSGGGTPTPAR